MRTRFLAPVLALPVVLSAGWGTATTGPEDQTPPSSLWRAGDGWPLSVILYSRDEPGPGRDTPEVLARYDMHVTVVGAEPVDGHACWKVDFIPKSAPAHIGGRLRVLVSKEDGWPRKVIRGDKPVAGLVEKLGDIAAITAAPEGFPLEVLSCLGRAELRAEGPATALTLSRQATADQTVLTATLRARGGDEWTVRQTWAEGEKWWREYERRRNGRLDLSARIATEHPLKRKGDEKAATAPPPSDSKKEPDPAAGGEPQGLASDPRLRAQLTLNLKEPKLGEVLEHLRNATGVALTADASMDLDGPAFGSLSLHNMAAWSVMEKLAQAPEVQGRWEKVEDGYRLVNARPVVASAGPRGWVGWLAGAVLLGVAVGGVVAVRYARQRAKP